MPFGRICSRLGGAICTDCNGRRCLLALREDDPRRHAKQRAHGRDTAGWKRLRGTRLKLNPECQLRRRGCTRIATTVHLRAELGGDHAAATIDDVLSACPHCHGVVDQPRSTEGRAQSRRPRPKAR